MTLSELKNIKNKNVKFLYCTKNLTHLCTQLIVFKQNQKYMIVGFEIDGVELIDENNNKHSITYDKGNWLKYFTSVREIRELKLKRILK